MHRIFIDTSGFFAWASADDARHRQAVEVMTGREHRFLTTDWILGETVNLLKARRKPHLALRLFDLMETTRLVELLYLDPERFWKAKTFWVKHQEHAFSFTDCTSFVVMKDLKVEAALTSDSDFRIAGLQPLLAGC